MVQVSHAETNWQAPNQGKMCAAVVVYFTMFILPNYSENLN